MKLRVSACWEKRDWGSGRRTWRRVPPMLKAYRRGVGPSEYAVRRLSGREAKKVTAA